ncbi:MAG: T9SS type A sorting domain-containing protein [Chitinophagales bacterium]
MKSMLSTNNCFLLRLFTAVVVLLTALPVRAQISQEWEFNYNGTELVGDMGWDIAVDANGNSIAVGYENDKDAVVTKYDPAGNLLWSIAHNGSANDVDIFYAVALDATNNIYVTGLSQEIGSSWDIITNKYSPEGDLMWSKLKNGTSDIEENGIDIAVDEEGNVYTAGYIDQIETAQDYCLIKYDNDGNELWMETWSGESALSDVIYEIVIDGNGNIIVNGRSDGGGENYDDFATAKYSPDGTLLWLNKYHQIYGETGFTIDVDDAGNVYAGGWAADGISMGDALIIKYSPDGENLWEQRYDNGAEGISEAWVIRTFNDVVYMAGVSADFPETNQDFMILKYDSDGNLIWDIAYDDGSADNEYLTDMDIDNEGNIVVSGTIYYETTSDILTQKYDADGNLIWSIKYDGDANSVDEGYAVATDNDGNVFITGFDINQGMYTDLFVVKYSEAIIENILQDNSPEFVIYPNPADEMIFIDAPFLDGDVYIYNSIGQLVQSNHINNVNRSIAVDELVAGNYFIFCTTDKETGWGNFIIK